MPYTAVVLDEKSRNDILARFRIGLWGDSLGVSGIHWSPMLRLLDDFDFIAHHMTVDLKPAEKSMAKDMIGQSVSMLVTTVGTDEQGFDGSISIIALGVITEVPSKNTRKHITVVLDPSKAKPKDSNNITNWTNITPFTVTGVVQEVK